MKATTKDAYKLMHDGAIALSQMEANGICIDVDLLEKTTVKVAKKIKTIQEELEKDELWKEWLKVYRKKANMGSRYQMADMLNKVHGFTKSTQDPKKKLSVDEKALLELDIPFIKRYLRMEKLKKLHSTYLKGIYREIVDGLLHPSFNLHLVRTGRSQSNLPNFQNIPIRDPKIGKLIRSCFVPRAGRVLVEIDFGSLEVRVSCCYNKDPALIEYIRDSSKDMHRDMAMECFMLPQEEVTKEIRFYAKNQFVFPAFYGSYFGQMAPDLWESVTKTKLITVSGLRLVDHLKNKGIKRLGIKDDVRPRTFMHHIREVEENFWGERFPVYAQWKWDWWKEYQKKGWFQSLTGFRELGVYAKNDVVNHPIQSSAFHCLLWSLIETQHWLNRNKMKTLLVGQIHDSILADVPENEIEKYISHVIEVTTVDLPSHWRWIIVPLEVEVETSSTNWWEKQKVKV